MNGSPARTAAVRQRYQIRQAQARYAAQARRAVAYTWGAMVRSIVARDGACRVCARPVVPVGSAADPLSWGHVHHICARADGGSDESENLVLLCGGCHDAERQQRIKLSGTASALWVTSAQGDGHP